MNILSAVAAFIMMLASTTPSNPAIATFCEEMQKQADAAGVPNPVSFEKTIFGTDALVISESVPMSTAELAQIPTEMVKTQAIQELKADNDSAELVKALIETNTTFIMRMVGKDGGTMDIIITPADLK